MMQKILDRKGKIIEEGDIVAFDIPITFGAGENMNTEMFDIFWGKAVEKGCVVPIDPISQKKDVLYHWTENPVDRLIIRKAPDPEVAEAMAAGGYGAQTPGDALPLPAVGYPEVEPEENEENA